MVNKKAQGALEFLTTYGWAFLVILIMIGALGYFGILNPTRFLPERCNINPEFSCEEFQLIKEGDTVLGFQAVLKNAVGQPIDIEMDSIISRSDVYSGTGHNLTDALAVEDVYGSLPTGGNAFECAISQELVSADNTFVLACTAAGTSLGVNLPGPGSKLKVSVDMKYVPQGKTLSKPISLEMFGALQQ